MLSEIILEGLKLLIFLVGISVKLVQCNQWKIHSFTIYSRAFIWHGLNKNHVSSPFHERPPVLKDHSINWLLYTGFTVAISCETRLLSLNRMASQWAETLVEIMGTLADMRGTTKSGCRWNFPKHEFNRPVCLEAHHYLLVHLSQ